MSVTAKALAATLAFSGLAACSAPQKADDMNKWYLLRTSSQQGQVKCDKTSSEMNAHAVEMSNTKRSWVGLHPIEASPVLAHVAAEIACDLAKKGTKSLSGAKFGTAAARAEKQGYVSEIVVKNVTVGNHDLNGILEQWNNSRGNLQNILKPQLRDVGIGTALTEDGKTRIWTAVYAVER